MTDSTDVPTSDPRSREEPVLTEDTVKHLLREIKNTQEGMYNCDETFALLDEYAELVSNGEEAARLMPLLKAHLDMCPDCHEQYEVLMQILETEEQA